MRKVFIITGPESSGSSFVSKIIAYYLGAIKNIDDWTGRSYCKSLNPNVVILHRSQPTRTVNQYCSLKEFKEEIQQQFGPYADIHFIITTRYHEFCNLSKIKRWQRTSEDIANNMLESKLILSEIIKSNEKYMIWNYETMLYLNEVYFDVLYDFVGGINKYYPKVTDGNINYMK